MRLLGKANNPGDPYATYADIPWTSIYDPMEDNLRNRLQQTADATRNIAEQASKEAEQRREQLMRQDNPALVALSEARQALAEAEAGRPLVTTMARNMQ